MVCATATGRKTTALNGSQRFQVIRHTARILEHTFVIAIDSQGDDREKTAAAVAATEGHKSGFSYVSVYAFDRILTFVLSIASLCCLKFLAFHWESILLSKLKCKLRNAVARMRLLQIRTTTVSSIPRFIHIGRKKLAKMTFLSQIFAFVKSQMHSLAITSKSCLS